MDFDDSSHFVKASRTVDALEVWKADWTNSPPQAIDLTYLSANKDVTSGDFFKSTADKRPGLSQGHFLLLVRYLRLRNILVNCEGKVLAAVNPYFYDGGSFQYVDSSGLVSQSQTNTECYYVRCLDGFNWPTFGLKMTTTFSSTPMNIETGVKLVSEADDADTSDGEKSSTGDVNSDNDEPASEGSTSEEETSSPHHTKGDGKSERDVLQDEIDDLNSKISKAKARVKKLKGLENHRTKILKVLNSCKTTTAKYETAVQDAKNDKPNGVKNATELSRAVAAFCRGDWPISRSAVLRMLDFWRSDASPTTYRDWNVRQIAKARLTLGEVIKDIS